MKNAVASFTEGMQRLQARDLEGAAQSFTASITAMPQFEPSFRLRAEVYKALGRTQEAQADLGSVVEITRARLQEAEQSRQNLGGRPPAPMPTATAMPAPSESASAPLLSSLSTVPSFSLPQMSPIILATIVFSVVMVIAALILILVAGDSPSAVTPTPTP